MNLTDHAITAEQVKLLVREGEGLTMEFKERYTPRIDEDILALSDPPYYTACPNPFVRDFIAHWSAEQRGLRTEVTRTRTEENSDDLSPHHSVLIPLSPQHSVLSPHRSVGSDAGRRLGPGLHSRLAGCSLRPHQGFSQDRGPAQRSALGRLTGHPGGDEEAVRGIPGRADQGQGTRQGADRVGVSPMSNVQNLWSKEVEWRR